MEKTVKIFFKGGAAVLAAFCCLSPARVGAQSLPLDDKARYEQSLEQKADEVLLRLLGPNQAKVVVQASMDFSRTEKVDIVSTSKASKADDSAFKWQNASGGDGQPFNEYLLPGFPAASSDSGPQSQTYQKQLLFPASLTKKLTVSVILNQGISDAQVQAVKNVVSEILNLDQARGDQLTVIKTPFASIWKTIWYTPDALNLVFKYGILTFMGIISMVVVSIGFLKLAGAMNTMARAQTHQITMDLGKGMGGAPGFPGPEPEGSPGQPKKEKEPSGGGEDGETVFNVRLDQVDFLVNLMNGEEPANVALVAGHLETEVRKEFLRRLPSNFSSEVLSSMARVRFVEPEVISTIQEELEKRLSGAFGGLSKVMESIDNISLKAKREMLYHLEKNHPDIAAEVRAKVLLPQDLLKLSDPEISLLSTSVKIEDWAYAVWELPEEFKERLKAQMAEKTWQMLEQTMKYGAPSEIKTDAAMEKVMEAAAKLIEEGRIANPLSAAPRGLPAPGAAPDAAPEAPQAEGSSPQ